MSLQGNLTDLPLEDLLQVFAVQNRTGMLYMRHADFDAEICFNRSTLHSAIIFRRTGNTLRPWRQGEDAMYELLNWSEGDFVFELGNGAAIPQNVFHSSNYIVLENLRRRDEEDEQQRYANLTSLCPRLLPNPPVQAQINLELDQWRLLFLINGRTTVAEIAQTTRRPSNEIIPLVLDMEKKGLIELPATSAVPVEANRPAPATNNWQPVASTPSRQAQEALRAMSATPRLPERSNSMPAMAMAGVGGGRNVTQVAPPKVQKSILSGIMSRIRGM